MHYHLMPVAPQVQPKTVKGKGLAHRKLSKAGKALLAVDICNGNVKLEAFSVGQLALLLGVSSGYIRAARALSVAQRTAVERGLCKLTEFLPAHALPNPQKQIAKVVQQIGVDQTLELLAATE